MILNDAAIASAVRLGRIGVQGYHGTRAVQPASLEVHLDWTDAPMDGQLELPPGAFLLAHTLETVTLPADIAAQLSGKSSLGRLGLLVHATAGWIDPGFNGQIVLELKNLHHDKTITLRMGQPVAQLIFHQLTAPARRPYGHDDLGSHYQGQRGTTPSYLEAVPEWWMR